MKVLVGVVAYGEQKKYVYSKFAEMAEACIAPHADLVVAGDASHGFPATDWIPMRSGIKDYVEDIIMEGREALRIAALEGGYDAYVHQGVDCLYHGRHDFLRLISHDVTIVGALTSARNDAMFPVARRFDFGTDFLETQHQIPDHELRSGNMVPAGYPGADALMVKRAALGVGYDGHTKWYDRVAQGRPNLECEENLLLQLSRKGFDPWLDTNIRTWHVHEDGIARRWPGEEKPLNELHWR